MKFSVWPSPERTWDELRDLARTADAGGWHGIWFADHYMPNTETGEVADGDVHECWAILPGLAAVTERLRLGTLVAPTTVHHPAVLANRAASVDLISNGRLVLGIGAGWQVNEHRAYGIELFEAADRVTRFEEAIQIVRSMLTQDRTTFEGRHFTVTDAPCQPRPVQSPLPLLVGTGSPRMMRITARHADEWNTWGDPDEATRRTDRFLAACEAVGRDPATVRRSAQAMVFMSDDESRLAHFREHATPDRSLVGTPAELVDVLGRYAELGFDEFIVPDFTLGRDPARRAEGYARFWSEVASHLT
jgi:F420-dependent oxidoreductase-like protein